ncbi:kinesin-like protein KIF26B isoform X1 [Synchiropus splendidus]|uniref:kinesin-like protein KIF26B isoform X1 n=1 Tax=Synchiropus splendidus TaxID=270530 RepID=UPI00237EBDC8|nr:kinesin-like protein KIF26B isoform X1 [Synchiropus splendidus]
MSSLTRRGERLTGSTRNWRTQVQHHGEFSLGNQESCRERPAPEGSRDEPLRNMCHRADAVPSYKSLPGSIGDRIMSFGTLCRGSVNPSRSDRKVTCCENCSATLVALKKQALSLAVHHHFSCKDSSDLSVFLYDNLRVHTRFNTESWEQGDCGACGTNLNKLKQEAVHLALSRGQSSSPFDSNHIPSRHADRAPRDAAHPSHSRTQSPYSSKSAPQSPKTPQRTPQTLRRRVTKPEMDRWVEEQLQLVSSNPGRHQAAADATIGGVGAGVVQTNSKIPHISRVVNIANTAAMSFLARAAEKLNLTSRKKGQASEAAPAHFPTCFREIIQKNPPPVPPCLLQAATRTRDTPDISKVRVVLRVNPTLLEAPGQPPVLRIDSSKKRVIVMEPGSQSLHLSTMTLGRDSRSLLKSFSFDAAYPQESSQAEVCAGVLADVIRCVLSGSDGCVLGLGCADVGSWTSMVGSDESAQKLGLIPTAISWLYAAVERRREKTWTDLSVSISAIELCCGEEDTLRDLLGEIVPSSSSFQGSPIHVKLQEDSASGIQIRNHNRVKAPTAERAASLLDAAIAARRHSDFTTFLSHTSIMFFTLHVQPPRTESSTIGKGSRGPTKLTMIDVCTGMGGLTGYYKNKTPHSELGPIVLSLLSGHRTIPKKSSKLTMLLRESMASASCYTTVVAQVTNSLEHLQDTFSTIHLASRIRRLQKRTKQSTSCSPRGRSLTREKRGPQPFSLRAFHSTDEVDVDVCKFRLRGELDEHSSSDQSCDTVIQMDSEGLIRNKEAQRTTQPKFVPIIPSLHPSKADMDDPEFTALLQELLRIPKLQVDRKKEEVLLTHSDPSKVEPKAPERDCLKCDTFAELQERLGCIDGKEATTELTKTSSKSPPCANHATKPQPLTESLKQKASDSSEAPQRLVNQRSGCSQPCAGETQTDGANPGDSFQREDSGLYDCEECSATSSSEEVMNQTPNVSCHGEPPKTMKGSDNALSHSFIVDATGDLPNRKQKYQELNDWFRSDERASPVGKSSPVSPPSSSSASQPLATSIIIGDELPKRPKENVKEVKATITVTVQQPLDLKGQDELVFSMVEEVTISGAVHGSRAGGNIICIRDNAPSPVQLEGQSSAQPIRIISNISDESSVTETSDTTKDFVDATVSATENSHQGKRSKNLLPSFINPMLIHSDMPCDLEENENPSAPSTRVTRSELRGSGVKSPDVTTGIDHSEASTSQMYKRKSCKKTTNSAFGQNPCGTIILEDSAENQVFEKNPRNTTDRSHPGDSDHVYSSNTQRGTLGEDMACRRVGNNVLIGVSHGCLDTSYPYLTTGSLPRGWQNANHQEHLGHMAEDQRDPVGVASSSQCSSGAPFESRHSRPRSPMTHNLHSSSAVKYEREYRQETSSLSRKGVGSLCDISGISMKRDLMPGRPMSPNEDCSRLFNTKLAQLVSKTNSLGRIPQDFPSLERGRSKGSLDWVCEGGHKGCKEGDCTLPRTSRSPKKDSRNSHKHSNSESQPSKHGHSKLSAVGKLKMVGPKVRRLSAPSIKNLSLPHKRMQQSINRSASLSPDSRTTERTSTFLSSSPPRSHRSLSRTPSQSSTCSSTKSAIQGFANGLISDFFKDKTASPTVGGSEQAFAVPSPYSQLTSPRTPTHMSGHASDTTSVLSGDLPPAMGKTSLHFSHRNSTMSGGYSSLFRDSEATAGGTSMRDSVSDRSGSPGSSHSRSSRRRGSTGTHQRRLSNDTPPSLRRSGSGVRSYSVDPDIPEAYEITLYEIDDVQRAQKKAGRTLQRQADVFGGSSAEDIRILQPDERRGAFHVNPRVRKDFHSGHRGASGSH